MEGVVQDLRYAVRKLAGAPAFTLAAVSTLAIGIGATIAIFSTVNATLLRPLPFSHPEDLVALRTALTDGRVTTGFVAAAEVERLNQSNTSIARAVAVTSSVFDVTLLRDNAAPVHAGRCGWRWPSAIRRSTPAPSARSSVSSATSGTARSPRRRSRASTCRTASSPSSSRPS